LRTTQFVVTEEARHMLHQMFVGETGLSRAIKRNWNSWPSLGRKFLGAHLSSNRRLFAVWRSIAPEPALHSRHETRG
jgi:hypothetical protein